MITTWEHYCVGLRNVLSLAAALTCVTAGLAQAKELTVRNLADTGPGSLRAAVLAANENPGADVIRFAPRLTGTIALQSELSVTDDLRIDGPGAGRLTVSGGGITRVLAISGDETDVWIDDLRIADGLATGTTVVGPANYVEGFLVVPGGSATLGGGILNMGASVTLDRVSLVNNQATAVTLDGVNAGGGGIANVFGATLTVAHSSFTGNQVLGGTGDSYGGAIFNDAGSSVTVKGCTFTGNEATAGAYLGSFGGAIANTGGSQAVVSDSRFKNNVARGGNGANGAPYEPGADAGNGAGGGIASFSWALLDGTMASTALTVSRSTFIGNQAVGGQGGDGGLGASGGAGAEGDGGAIAPMGLGSSAIVSTCVFTGNRGFGGAGGNGGAEGNGGNGGVADGGAVDVASAVPDGHGQFVRGQPDRRRRRRHGR